MHSELYVGHHVCKKWNFARQIRKSARSTTQHLRTDYLQKMWKLQNKSQIKDDIPHVSLL